MQDCMLRTLRSQIWAVIWQRTHPVRRIAAEVQVQPDRVMRRLCNEALQVQPKVHRHIQDVACTADHNGGI